MKGPVKGSGNIRLSYLPTILRLNVFLDAANLDSWPVEWVRLFFMIPFHLLRCVMLRSHGEYGSECYCGDVVDIETNGGAFKPESDCKTTCPGDPRYYCGGGSRLSYYAWSLTDPLYKWNYASGNDAGNYKLFVPGVVVPLITTVGVNGKITFVEKAGTGPANSVSHTANNIFQ